MRNCKSNQFFNCRSEKQSLLAFSQVRKGRLTANNSGTVINGKRVTPSLIKRLLGEYDISRVKAVAWGNK